MIKVKSIVFIILISWLSTGLFAQVATSDSSQWNELIKVLARPSKDSIVLRWAPVQFSIWQNSNKYGYMLERYTILRDGKLIPVPEKIELTPVPILPWPEEQWEQLVKIDRYAPLAAQSLFGESFEVNMKQSDPFQIVNKAREDEQRFSMALLSADLSFLVAKASALGYVDKTVKKGEKYLYRVITKSIESGTVRGGIYISSEEKYQLPVISNVTIDVKNRIVSLKWEQPQFANPYIAYQVERSTDNTIFKSISDIPLLTLSEKENIDLKFHYAADSLPNNSQEEFYYRVRGITSFGEIGDGVSIHCKNQYSTESVPHIISGQSVDNKTVELRWDYPAKAAGIIQGFDIERSRKGGTDYKKLTPTLLDRNLRSFNDLLPEQINYYQVVAVLANGERLKSFSHFVQLVDSIPPQAPVGLIGSVDEYGKINLKWKNNIESDLFGYRIFRANFSNEEFYQVTSEPVPVPEFSDKISLNTLNDFIYYKVVAIDRNQNQSPLSQSIKIPLPDNVKPMAPVPLPISSSQAGVVLKWLPSGSTDVVRYDIFRKYSDQNQWMRVKSIEISRDSVLEYNDTNTPEGKINYYTIIAVDDAGLESEPSMVLKGSRIVSIKPPVKFEVPIVEKEKGHVLLRWIYDQANVRLYRIFRAKKDAPFSLYKTVQGSLSEYPDTEVAPNQIYSYRIMAIFENEAKSELSSVITVEY